MNSKICTKCNVDKPITEYYTIVTKNNREYTYNYCKKCHYSKMTKHTSKKWRKQNPEQWKQDVKKAQQAMYDRDREGVYILITTKGLYVGKTDKYQHRVQQHRNNNFKGNVKAKGAKVLANFLLEEINDPKQRSIRERYWINKLKPALNRVGNPDYKKTFGNKYEKR